MASGTRFSPLGSTGRLWAWLTRPHASVQEVGERRQLRILSGFLILFFLCALSGAIATALTPTASGQTSYPMLAAFSVALGLGYGLSRTQSYRIGLWIALVAMIVMPHIGGLLLIDSAPAEISRSLHWLIIPIILGSIYLPFMQMFLLLGAVSTSVLLWPLLGPSTHLTGLIEVSGLVIGLSSLVTWLAYHRNAIERDRLGLLKAKTKELTRANEQMENLLFAMSHDLREPMRSVQSFSKIIQRRYADKIDEAGQDRLTRLVRATIRMRQQLDDLMKLAQIQKLGPPTEEVTGTELIKDTLERLEDEIQESRSDVRIVTELPTFVVHRSWAVEAICQIVDNALKFSQEGEAPVVEIDAYRGSEGVGLVIRDRGAGVSEQYAETIFQLFKRAVGREVQGTGAGLAIARNVAERHGGNAWLLCSDLGRTEFAITLGPPENLEQ